MMHQPVIVFRHFPETPSLRSAIERHVEKLTHSFPTIEGCRVLVEAPHHHHRKGNPFHVRVGVNLRGRNIVVDPRARDQNLYTALNDSFGVVTKQLHNYLGRFRGNRKGGVHHKENYVEPVKDGENIFREPYVW